MTVKFISEIDIRRYQGLSTDEKPTATEGSTFYSIDTGDRWIYHDGWIPSTQDIGMVWDTGLLAPVLQQQSLLITDDLIVGGEMSVSNFPTTQPVSGEVAVTDHDPTAKYKIADIDPTGVTVNATRTLDGIAL